MGTKYRLSVKTAALAGVVCLLAGCVQISQWEDTLQEPREWDGCALGGALAGAAAFGISAYFVANGRGDVSNKDDVKAVYIPIFTILGGGLGALAGHYICDPIIPPPPPAPAMAEAPPPPPPPPAPAPQERIVLRGVHFDFNRYNIRPDAAPILDEAADILSKHPDVTVDVNGYCDIIGSYRYNLRLSQRRANSVAHYLEGKGIASSRLVTHGYGKTHFVATNRTAEGRAQNRRVELVPVGS